MNRVETTYRGHKIYWSDNADCWTCRDLDGKMQSAPKLSSIKAHIDKLYLSERKQSAVPCFEIGHSGDFIEGSVVEYLGQRVGISWRDPNKIGHKVAVVARREGSGKPSRREASLDEVFPMSPDTVTAYENYKRLENEAKAAQRAAYDAKQAIPRMTPEDVQALIDIYKRGEGND